VTSDARGSISAPGTASFDDGRLDAFFIAGGGNGAAPVAPPQSLEELSRRQRKRAGKLQARKVRRIVRHLEPWSVLKVSLVFYFCLWVILMIAGTLMWGASGATIDNVETFIKELLALEEFEFDGEKIFRASALGGLVMVVAGTGFTVLFAVVFNLISDLMGGIRVTVVEEETARPVGPRS
jgi:hypothetical protein